MLFGRGIESAAFEAKRCEPLLPVDVRVFYGRRHWWWSQTESTHGVILRCDAHEVVASLGPLTPNELASRWLARFAWTEQTAAWELIACAAERADFHHPAPFDGMDIDCAAARLRMTRRCPPASFRDAYDHLEAALAANDALPSHALLELGIAAEALGRRDVVEDSLSRTIAAGPRELATAHAVRARNRIERGDLAGAESDITALRSLPNAGVDERGEPFPHRWNELEATFLTGLLADARGDSDSAVLAFEAIAGDGSACEVEKRADPEFQLDMYGWPRAESTLEPAMTRHMRAAIARRALGVIDIKRGMLERALTRLAPLGAARDHLLRAKVLMALNRTQEAISHYERARDGGVEEAVQFLAERQRRAPLESTRKAVKTAADGIDIDDRVSHAKFGAGVVLDVEVNGTVARITIRFDDGATRTLPSHLIQRH
jgi:tetratricopeptide (TPR) repeat protein